MLIARRGVTAPTVGEVAMYRSFARLAVGALVASAVTVVARPPPRANVVRTTPSSNVLSFKVATP
jgi:hypothetical protein